LFGKNNQPKKSFCSSDGGCEHFLLLADVKSEKDLSWSIYTTELEPILPKVLKKRSGAP